MHHKTAPHLKTRKDWEQNMNFMHKQAIEKWGRCDCVIHAILRSWKFADDQKPEILTSEK